jgi:hypothetical protein
MYMLRHHHVAAYEEVVPHPQRLQRTFENLSRRGRSKMLVVSITTERDKMKITGILIADEGMGHETS